MRGGVDCIATCGVRGGVGCIATCGVRGGVGCIVQPSVRPEKSVRLGGCPITK